MQKKRSCRRNAVAQVKLQILAYHGRCAQKLPSLVRTFGERIAPGLSVFRVSRTAGKLSVPSDGRRKSRLAELLEGNSKCLPVFFMSDHSIKRPTNCKLVKILKPELKFLVQNEWIFSRKSKSVQIPSIFVIRWIMSAMKSDGWRGWTICQTWKYIQKVRPWNNNINLNSNFERDRI